MKINDDPVIQGAGFLQGRRGQTGMQQDRRPRSCGAAASALAPHCDCATPPSIAQACHPGMSGAHPTRAKVGASWHPQGRSSSLFTIAFANCPAISDAPLPSADPVDADQPHPEQPTSPSGRRPLAREFMDRPARRGVGPLREER